jgi:hypothetical protein
VMGIFDGIRSAAKKIGDVIDSLPSLPSLPFAATAPAGGPGTTPQVHGLRAARAGSQSSGPTTINVFTTGDTIEAERAVVRALRRQTRLNAGVVPAFGWASGTTLARGGGLHRHGRIPTPRPAG